jgi:hypothetical protein
MTEHTGKQLLSGEKTLRTSTGKRKLTLAPLNFKEAVSDLLKIKPEPKQKPEPKTKRKAKK